MGAEEPTPTVAELWARVVREMKQGPVNVLLWEAMEKVQPIVIEDDRLVVGLTTEDFHLSGHMTQGQPRRDIHVLLSRFLGRECHLEVIEGTSAGDWETEKSRRAALASATPAVRVPGPAARDPWEQLNQELTQRYHSLENKSAPRALAEYLLWALGEVCRVRGEAEQSGAEAQGIERGMSRILHRLASQTQLPPAQVGLEYLRLAQQSAISGQPSAGNKP